MDINTSLEMRFFLIFIALCCNYSLPVFSQSRDCTGLTHTNTSRYQRKFIRQEVLRRSLKNARNACFVTETYSTFSIQTALFFKQSHTGTIWFVCSANGKDIIAFPFSAHDFATKSPDYFTDSVIKASIPFIRNDEIENVRTFIAKRCELYKN